MFVWLLSLGIGFAALTWFLTVRLTPENKQDRIRRWLLSWTLRGLALPVLLWAAMNIGLSLSLQPFMPAVQAARNHGGNWVPEYLHVLGDGLIVISSYWCALTLSWLLTSAVRAADPVTRKEFKSLCLTCLLGLSIPAALVAVLGRLPAAGMAAALLLGPMAGYGRELLQPRKMPPMYSRAVARMKFGKYNEAEWEIIKELENWEDDFEGWMMLAGLYANQFKDLAEAERTVLDLCGQPTITPSQASVALHRLAEWQLNLGQDPDAARRTLLIICERFAGTHLAHMAQLRINQLPASGAELREQRSNPPIPLPALGDQMDLPPQAPAIDREKAAKLANACVEQLKQNPNNVAAREKLARILTEQLDKAPQGIEQIQLLLEMPDRSDAERAGWIGLVAAWEIKYRQDVEAGRHFLEQVIREYPSSIQAFGARRRLELLSRQARSKSS